MTSMTAGDRAGRLDSGDLEAIGLAAAVGCFQVPARTRFLSFLGAQRAARLFAGGFLEEVAAPDDRGTVRATGKCLRFAELAGDCPVSGRIEAAGRVGRDGLPLLADPDAAALYDALGAAPCDPAGARREAGLPAGRADAAFAELRRVRLAGNLPERGWVRHDGAPGWLFDLDEGALDLDARVLALLDDGRSRERGEIDAALPEATRKRVTLSLKRLRERGLLEQPHRGWWSKAGAAEGRHPVRAAVLRALADGRPRTIEEIRSALDRETGYGSLVDHLGVLKAEGAIRHVGVGAYALPESGLSERLAVSQRLRRVLGDGRARPIRDLLQALSDVPGGRDTVRSAIKRMKARGEIELTGEGWRLSGRA